MAGFPCFYASSESGSHATFQKIIDWEQTLQEVYEEVELTPSAKNLISRYVVLQYFRNKQLPSFLSEPQERIGRKGGAKEIKKHAFFDGMDVQWENIRAAKAPIIPRIEVRHLLAGS